MKAKSTPETPNRFINEHEVTLGRLKDELANVMIDAMVNKESALFVFGMALCRPVWIEINAYRKRITFTSSEHAPPCSRDLEVLRLVNSANASIDVIKFRLEERMVRGHHWLSYVGGLSVHQLVKTLQWFDKSFGKAMMLEPVRI